MALIANAADANCVWSNPHTVIKDITPVDVWNVTYTSYEVVNGQMHPILIKGFAAKPSLVSATLPGVVVAHGLGGMAKEENATGPAALLGTVTLAFTGPGGGDAPDNTSEGVPAAADNGYKMFDTVEDPRGTWFWGHAVAAMRAATCLEHSQYVDPARLGITGFSAGGVISLISSSVDQRIKVAVPLSGTLAWDIAVQAPKAWQLTLLDKAGLTTSSPEWGTLMNTIIGAGVLLPGSQAKVMMVNGTTDEFFPLTAHMASFNALPGAEKRTAFAANFDHGCYSLTGIESAADIENRAKIRAEGGQRAFFSHHFGTDPDFSYFPMLPTVQAQATGPITVVTALVDQGGSKLKVEEVRFWLSNDDAFYFASQKLDDNGNGLYSAMIPVGLQANSVYFVDVQYKTSNFIFPKQFALASPPAIPAGFVPHIRDINSCL
jgi:cephalosporin-C deacetylase-like acetyl esterase